MKIQFPQRLVSMLMVLIMLFTMSPAYVIAESGHDHDHETTDTSVVTVEELKISASASATYVYAGEEPVAVTAKITGGLAPYEVTLQAVKDGAVVSTEQVTTESSSASLSFAPASYGDYELVVVVHDALHAQVLTSVSLAVAEHDIESGEKWAASVTGASVSSNWASSLVSVAKTQVGYAESVKDFVVNNGQKQGYSRYGAWYGAPYSAWNAAFVAFVAEYANVPTDGLLAGYGYRSWVNGMSSKGAYEKVGSGYAPKAGDIAFLSGSRVAIVESVSGETVTVIEGDVDGKVVRQQVALSNVVGFGNTALMQGLHDGTATVVPTQAPAGTPVPGEATEAPTATPKPTATPVPEIEGEMTLVATPVPGPGVTAEPKDDVDILDLVTGNVGDKAQELAAEATPIPAVFSDAFYALQAEVQAIYNRYIDGEMSDADIQAFVESLTAEELYYIIADFDTIEEFAINIGISEYEVNAIVEVEEKIFTFIKTLNERLLVLLPDRAASGTGTVLDGQITLSWAGGTSSSNVDSTKNTATFTAQSSISNPKTNTVTITNTSGSKAKLTFEWTKSGSGSHTFPKSPVTIELSNGASVTYTVTGMQMFMVSDASVTLKNFKLEIDTSVGSIELVPSKNGDVIYTLAGETVTVSTESGNKTVADVSASAGFTATVAPDAGATFVGWMNPDTNEYLAGKDGAIYPVPGETIKAMPVIVKTEPVIAIGTTTSATYKVADGSGLGGSVAASMATVYTYKNISTLTHIYTDFNEAMSAAANSSSKYAVLLNDATLGAGSYEIPEGVTLLIPFDEANTLYTDYSIPVPPPAGATTDHYVTPTPYRTLTMGEGATLTINGAMSLSGKHRVAQGSYRNGSSPMGPQGYVHMKSSSSIIVNGTLYAYGYIYGSGSVTANSGSKVYEMFQFMDFLGGSQSTEMKNEVFPLSQYYIQNIEVFMTINSGATIYAFTTIYMSASCFGNAVAFIGDGNSGAMFQIANGYVTKQYDGSTDRLILHSYGDVSLSPIKMQVGISSINSASYILGINSNMSINAKSGTITMKQNLGIHPGVEVTIAKDVKCVLGSGVRVYVYDVDEWGPYAFDAKVHTINYAPGKNYTRTEADLKDASFKISGEIVAIDGELYTTLGGAKVEGTEGATITMAQGVKENVYQLKFNGNANNAEYKTIPVTNAKLLNGDGSYTEYYNPDGATNYNSFIYIGQGENGRWELCATGDKPSDTIVWTHQFYGYKEETEPKCGTPGMEVAVCACGKTLTDGDDFKGNPATKELAAKEHDVEGQPWNDVDLASCITQTNGTRWRECKACGEPITEEVAWTHVPGETVTVPATCVAKGSETVMCAACKGEISSTELDIDPDAHVYDEGKVTVEPGCETVGTKTFTCTLGCGAFYTEEIKANGHKPNRDKATCTEDQICTVCENVLTEATGHLNTVDVPGTPATCVSDGYTAGKNCVECGHPVVPQQRISHTTIAHTWPEEGEVTPATCTEDGYTIYHCTVDGCAATNREVIKSNGHTETYVNAKDATCGAPGKKADTYCTACNTTLAVGAVIPATGEHVYGTLVSRVEPDCGTATDKYCSGGTPGSVTYKCTGCDKTQTTTINAEHDFESEGGSIVVTSPTCFAPGYTTYTCATCKKVYEADATAQRTHDMVATEEVVPATCQAQGYTVYACSYDDCEYTEKRDYTGPLDHDYSGAWYVITEATCLTEGSQAKLCVNGCEQYDPVNRETIPATGHSWGNDAEAGWEPEGEAKCSAPLKQTRTCKNAGCTVTEERTLTVDHDMVTLEGYAATCTQPGLTTVTYCKNCDTWPSEQTTIEPLKHQYADMNEDGIIDENDAEYTDPTCTDNGYWTYICISQFHDTEKDGITDVVVVDENSATDHDFAATWTSDEDGHWYACLNGCGEKQGYEVHSWTDATCTAPKTCSVCERTEGEPLEHVFSEAWMTTEGAETHWHACEYGCGTKSDETAHVYNVLNTTEEQHWFACDCGVQQPAEDHAFGDWASDVTGHWKVCGNSDCGYTMTVAEHIEKDVEGKDATCKVDGLTDGLVCEICEWVITPQEIIDHTTIQHQWKAADCSNPKTCEVCGTTDGEPQHSFVEAWSYDDSYHWHKCANCEDAVSGKALHAFGAYEVLTPGNCETGTVMIHYCDCGASETYTEEVNPEAHNFVTVTEAIPATCTTPGVEAGGMWCDVCHLIIMGEIPAAHNYSELWETNEDGHWHICLTCGLSKDAEDAHVWGETWMSEGDQHWHECKTCGYKVDEGTHEFGTDLTIGENTHWYACVCGAKKDEGGHTFDTAWEIGNGQHWHECTCGAKSAVGNHAFTLNKYDDGSHWTECECGDRLGVAPHEFKPEFDEDQHYDACDCGAKKNVADHKFESTWDDEQHYDACACGAKKNIADHQFVIEFNAEKHYDACACGATKNHADHVLTKAWNTDQHWDVCVCGYKTAEIGHTLEVACDETKHWTECACGYKTEEIGHTLEVAYDETNHWTECDCGYKTEEIGHSLEGEYDETNHWTECTCGYKTEEIGHSLEGEYDETNHWTECTCGYKTEEIGHSLEGKFDETNHWTECTCGYKTAEIGHTLEGTYDETKHWTECTCGYKTAAASHALTKEWTDSQHWDACDCGYNTIPADHDFTGAWAKDAADHWKVCVCGAETEHAAHIAGDEATETEPQLCTECEYVITPATGHINHRPGTTVYFDGTSHWNVCVGCPEKLNVEEHKGGEATCTAQAVCDVCVQPYGEMKTHDFSTEWTFDETGHWYVCLTCNTEKKDIGDHEISDEWKSEGNQHWHECKVCGFKLNVEDHVCDITRYDETNHWTECVCGYKTIAANHVLTKAWDDAQHWEVCDCGYKTTPADHVLAKAWDDAQHWEVCDCGYKTDAIGHTLEGAYDETNHWTECDCGYKTAEISHSLVGKYDETNHWTECTCGYKTAEIGHSLEGEYDETNHWTECDCGYKTAEIGHTLEGAYDETNHWTECDCGYKTAEIGHSLVGKYDETNHWTECTCGYKTAEIGHSLEGEYDETNHWTECTCGYKTAEIGHSLVGKYDETNHWTECTCGYKTEEIGHSLQGKFDETKHWTECTCGYKTEEIGHSLESEYDETNHWTECTCGYKTEEIGHSLEGKFDETNHWTECICGYKTEAIGHSLEGQFDETNHWNECTCGYKTEEVDHEFVIKSDDDNHWYVCACGAKTEAVAHVWDKGVGTGATFDEAQGKWVTDSCTEDGQVFHVCTVEGCGAEKTETIIKRGHVNKAIIAKNPTCEEAGWGYGVECATCGTILTEPAVKPALNHDPKLISSTPATCLVDGVEAYKCNRPTCGKEWTEVLKAPGHTKEIMPGKDATCTETGLNPGEKCSVCDEVLTEQTTIPAKGHTFAEELKDAVCAVRTCDTCGKDIQPEAEHDYDIVIKDPTHQEKGMRTYTCKRNGCGHSYTEDIDMIEHEYSKVVTAPTCAEKGYTTYTCICGDSYVSDYVDATGKHTYGEWVIDQDSTCTAEGSKHRTCTVCEEATEDGTVEMKAHIEETIPAVASTCTVPGKSEGKKCTVCGTITVKQIPQQLANHELKTYEYIAATCLKDGQEAKGQFCVNCSFADAITVIPATGHSMVTDYGYAAGCTTDGLTNGSHCKNCDDVTTAQQTIPATGHEHTIEYAEEPSTCTVKGLSAGVYCEDCKTWLTPRKGLELAPHTEKIIPAVEPTCTTTGSTEGKTCTVCNQSIVSVTSIPAKGHTEVIDAAVEPTCTEPGKGEGKHCSVCNAILVAQKNIPAKGHTEVIDKAIAATCTETGKSEGKHCSVCNEVLVAQTEVEAKGHTEVIDKAVAATCTENGKSEGKHCSVCNEVLVAQNEVEAKGHTEQIVAAVPATCTATGLTEGKKCSVCGTTLTAQTSVPANGHTEVIDAAVAVTCTTDGKTEGKHCSVCNTVLVEQKVIEHKGHQPVVDARIEATCTVDGKTEGSHCSVCGETLVAQEVITKTGHTEVIDEGTAATCLTSGMSEGKHCSVCNEILIKQEYIPAKGHTAQVVAAVPATCTAEGKTEGSVCAECDVVLIKQNAVEALGHAWDVGVEEPKHTCTEPGELTQTCTRDGCDAINKTEVFAAHTIVTDEAIAPTCNESGWTKRVYCSECDFVQTEKKEVPAAHTWQDVEILVAPTCTSTGSKSVICAIEGCGATDILTIEKLPHTEVIDPAVAETCTTDGITEGSHCSVCNAVIVAQQIIEACHDFDVAPCTSVPATCQREGCDHVVTELVVHDLAPANCTTPATCKYGCGYTEGTVKHVAEVVEEVPAQCTDAGKTEGSRCSLCGKTLVPQKTIDPLGHAIAQYAAKKPTFTSVGWDAYEACSRCNYTTYNEIPSLGEQSIDTFDELVTYLPYLEEWAIEFAKKTPGTDPVDLVIKYIRTGVDRYNSGSWGIMAGYENAEFAKYVNQKEDEINAQYDNVEDMIQVSGLKNLKEFKLPNGNLADLGHMFGTMDITNHNKGSVNHADVGGWAGDLVDLLSTVDHDDHQEALAAVVDGNLSKNFENVVTFIRTKLLGFDTGHGDDFAKNDIWGDLDAFYIMQTLDAENYAAGDLSDLFSSYFVSSLDDVQRADFLLANRLDDVTTRSAIREAVYNAYTTNSVISTLEGTREFVNTSDEDLIVMRKAVCYAFADWLCIMAGDWVEDTDNPYLTDFESTYSLLAPGISMEIHKATSADNQQMVYYLGYADVGRDDVHVMANYQSRDPGNNWGMTRVMEQAYAAQEFHSNPDDPDNYIENFQPIIATNGAGFNMSTGEPSGLLLMHGVEYHSVRSDSTDGFFGITKDGRAVIGTDAEYEAMKDQLVEGISAFGSTLVKDGELYISATSNYYTDRASRTAIGITATGRVVLMVLDGRQIPWSCGGSMIEIAQIMKLAGCVDAVNLDGGGSTTFVARQAGDEELSVVNRPSDGVQRSVSTSLMIVSTAPSSTAFDRAIIEADYNFMTAGATVNVKATGLSATNNIVELPEGTYWAVSNEERAAITADGVVTTNPNYVPKDENDNSFEVYLMLDGNILAQKTLTVVVPDMLYFTREKIDGIYGKSTELPLKARYEGKEVAFTADDIVFTTDMPVDKAPAGVIEGFNFVAVEESDIKTVRVTATLDGNKEVAANITVILYKDGENNFDFENATGGDRQLAWKREVTNSTYEKTTETYYIVDGDEPMVTSYTIALDMSQIPIPEKLSSLTYMLPGADTPDASAWFFLLNLAQRISDMTEVTPKITIDPNFDVDYSELEIINDYFELKETNFDPETNTLSLKLNWKRATSAIDVATANPMCIVSGLKLTPKEGTDLKLKPVNKADISYVVYMRANALYTFANKPENQKEFDIYPYVDDREGPYKGESGGYFAATYATFTDTYTLERSLKNGWVIEAGGFRYYVNNEYYVGIHKIDELYYQFDENGINVGQTAYTGLLVEDGYTYYLKNGEKFKGWISLDDGNWYFFDWQTARGAHGSVVHEITDEEKVTVPVTYDFENGRLLDGVWYRTTQGWRYYYGPYYYKQGWRQLNSYEAQQKGTWEPEMYFFEGYYVQKGVSPVQEAHATYEYWYEFTEGELAPGYLIGHAAEGLYWWDDDWYLGEKGTKTKELYYVKANADKEYSLAFTGGVALVDGDYYYFPMSGQAWRNKVDWVNESSANGLLPAGNYRFGNDGKIDMSTSIDNENGTLYYYYNGKRTANAGIVEFEGEKYYIGSNAIATVGASVWVATSKTNGLVAGEGTYYFDEDGHLINKPAIIKEDANYYYYNANGKRQANAGLVMFEGAYYHIGGGAIAAVNTEVNVTKTNNLLPAGTYRFDAEGKAILTTELVEENGKLNYYVSGKLNKDAGLINYEGSYYFITADGSAVRGAEYTVSEDKANGLFPADTYEFAADGKMIIREGIHNGYYYVAGAKNAAGLIKIGEDYYYAAEGGKIVTNAKYDVTKTNDLLPAGTYRFNAEGKAIMTTELANESGVLSYYVSGRLAEDAGLVKIGEDYYYITEDGSAVAGAKHNVVKTNGLVTAGTYRFDEDGKAIMDTYIVEETGVYSYYENGRLKPGAKLVKVGEDYYYIDNIGHALTNQKQAITAGDILPEGIYRIGADGKFDLDTELVDDHGYLTYYKNGILTKNAGLIQMNGDYYYIDEFGYAVKDTKQDVQKTNNLLPAGVYRFGEDCKAILTTELVNEDGVLNYYKDGMLAKDAGLIYINAAYYYIDETGAAVANTEMLVEKTNDLLPEGTYRFGEDGKAILTTELVEEDGKLNYYIAGMLAKDAGLIKYEGDYYYITEDGSAAMSTKVDVTAQKANGLFPADTYEFGADGKMVIYDGVIVNGHYYEAGVKTAAGLVKIGEDYYYAGEGGKIAVSEKVAVTEETANGLFPADTYEFGADGKMVIYDGVIVDGYYYEAGVKTAAGLVKIGEDYYYAGENGKIVMSDTVAITEETANGLFPAGTYEFGTDGKMVIYDGIIVGGYYYEAGVKTEAGLVKIGEDYYYAAEGGKIVTDAKYEITKTNDLLPAGTYRIDEEGKLNLSTELVDEEGKLTYYENGKLTADAGLIKVGEDYYYIGEDGIAVTDVKVEVAENEWIDAGLYRFGADGKAILTTELANEDGKLVYYKNGKLTKDAGLVTLDGSFYYIDADGLAVTNTELDVEKTNGLLAAGTYRFDENGKAILTTELVEEDGKLNYYVDGKLAEGAGLIKYEDAYYFIAEDGSAVKGEKVAVTEEKANNLFPADTYEFGEDGKMVIYDGVIINGYYYEDGVKTAAGLIKVDGDYYYAAEGGKIVTDAKYEITKTNDLLEAGTYRFDETGKLILTTGLVTEDGKLTYYKDGKLTKDAGLIKDGEHYYYIDADGTAVMNAMVDVTDAKANGLFPADTYKFGADGKMVIYDGVIVNGYYYEAGVKTEAGLVKLGEDYYYAAEGGKIVTDAKYDVTNTNDLLPAGTYRIDEEGKLNLTTELVDEEGKLTYYEAGKLAEDAGLIKIGEDYYYIGEDGTAVTDTTMTVEKTNDLLPAGEYTFGEDGKLIFKDDRLAGDANEDGVVDIFDALLILQYDVGWNVTVNLENANVNADEFVDIFDALLILQYDVGWNVELI